MTVRDAISLAGGVLGGADGWRLDAEVLLGHVLGWRRIEIFSRPEQALSPDEEVRYRALLERRSRHEPVAYITGQREFYGRPFEVGPGVLVPRPESEMLVDIVLAHCREQKHDLRMIDIGTGSGALAVTLALEIPSPCLGQRLFSAGPRLGLAQCQAAFARPAGGKTGCVC